MSYSMDEKQMVLEEQDRIIREQGLSVGVVPIPGGHIALDIDRRYLVLFASDISVEDLVHIGRFLGVIR